MKHHRKLLGFFAVTSVLCLMFIPIRAAETIDDILRTMSLEHRVAQMFMVSFYGAQVNAPFRDLLETWHPGAVALFPSNIDDAASVTRLTNSLQSALVDSGGVPMLIAVDQEGGKIAHLQDGFTTWPVPMLITATGDVNLAYSVGEAVAAEMRAVGVNMNLAPVADLNTNPNNPIIGRRSFGTDADQVGPIVAGYVAGLQAGGVLATVKHFPGHGDTDVDSHLTLPVLPYDLNRLESVELRPFEAAIEADVGAVMVAHIWFPALDNNELPGSLSPTMVTGLLRAKLGYDGLIMTDALDMDAIDTRYSASDASIMAIQAGHDLLAIGAHVSPDLQIAAMQAVVDAVNDGTISENRINDSVRRILQAKERLGLLDWQPLDADTVEARIDREEHEALVRELFQRGITLVRDDTASLPIAPDRPAALIYPATRPSIRQLCEVYSDSIRALGVSQNPTTDEINWAKTTAQQAEVTVVFTSNADDNTAQQALVRALDPEKTIVVALWSPYDLLGFPDVSGYIAVYSPLPAGIITTCELLFGEIPPTGRLPVPIGDLIPTGSGIYE